MKSIHTVCYSTLILIGVVHIIFAFFQYEAISLEVLWFIGSGLAIAFAGLSNLVFYPNRHSRVAYRVNQLINVLLLLFIVSITWTLVMIPGIVGMIVNSILIYTSWKLSLNSIRQAS